MTLGLPSHLNGADSETTASDDMGLQILIVDDDASFRENCASVLRLGGHSVFTCAAYADAERILETAACDVVLLNVEMDGSAGYDLLKKRTTMHPAGAVIVTTATPTVSASIKAAAAGAQAYLPKPFSANHLQILIGRAATEITSRRAASARAEESFRGDGGAAIPLVGNTELFLNTVSLARKAANTDASIFIFGESGTGKEQIANLIHAHSRRSNQRLVAINCAALPEMLLESEMFGHVKGAFTDASRDKPGLLEVASGGTMFLDELTEMPTTTQAKLLRVLQDGVVRRLGSNSVDAVVNVRFIAATNRDPREAVKTGNLREDLYYRLRVVPIRIPALRERVSDIPLLAEFFLRRYWERHREPGLPLPAFSAAAMNALKSRVWRGNVRELQNVIEHAVLLANSGEEIQPEDLPVLDATAEGNSLQPDCVNFAEAEGYYANRDLITSSFERTYLKWLVGKASGNMSMAARIAGVDRTTLYRLLEKHSVRRDTIFTVR